MIVIPKNAKVPTYIDVERELSRGILMKDDSELIVAGDLRTLFKFSLTIPITPTLLKTIQLKTFDVWCMLKISED